MFRRSVLICALVFCAPMVYSALVEQSISLQALGIRYLIAIPVAAALVALVRAAVSSAHAENESERGDTADTDARDDADLTVPPQ